MMYNNVSKVLTCESIERMHLGDVLYEFDDAIQYILGSRETITAYMSDIPPIVRAGSVNFEHPIIVFHIDSTCAKHPKYQECMELFSGYVDTELFFTEVIDRGLDYLCFMNSETCVIVYTPNSYRVKSERLESEVKQLQNIPNWIVRFFNRGGR